MKTLTGWGRKGGPFSAAEFKRSDLKKTGFVNLLKVCLGTKTTTAD